MRKATAPKGPFQGQPVSPPGRRPPSRASSQRASPTSPPPVQRERVATGRSRAPSARAGEYATWPNSGVSGSQQWDCAPSLRSHYYQRSQERMSDDVSDYVTPTATPMRSKKKEPSQMAHVSARPASCQSYSEFQDELAAYRKIRGFPSIPSLFSEFESSENEPEPGAVRHRRSPEEEFADDAARRRCTGGSSDADTDLSQTSPASSPL